MMLYEKRPRKKHKLPKRFKPQFEGEKIGEGRKRYLHRIAKKNTWAAARYPKGERPIRRSILSDKPLNYDKYLSEPYWHKLRTEVLATRDSCERCGVKYRLNLHHRYYYRNGQSVLYRERSYTDVFEVLCHPCHMLVHDRAEFGW